MAFSLTQETRLPSVHGSGCSSRSTPLSLVFTIQEDRWRSTNSTGLRYDKALAVGDSSNQLLPPNQLKQRENGRSMRTISPTLVLGLAFLACVLAAATTAHGGSAPRSSAQLFSKYCSSCHGKDGRAKTVKAKFKHARDITDPKWQDEVSDERIFNSIMNGRDVRGKMPAFGKKITDAEADSLVDYVRHLRK